MRTATPLFVPRFASAHQVQVMDMKGMSYWPSKVAFGVFKELQARLTRGPLRAPSYTRT